MHSYLQVLYSLVELILLPFKSSWQVNHCLFMSGYSLVPGHQWTSCHHTKYKLHLDRQHFNSKTEISKLELSHTRDYPNVFFFFFQTGSSQVMHYIIDPVDSVVICLLLDLLYHKIDCFIWGNVMQHSIMITLHDKSDSTEDYLSGWGNENRKRDT